MIERAILFMIIPIFLACNNNRKTDTNLEEKNRYYDKKDTQKVSENRPSIESFIPYFVEQKSGDILWIQTKNIPSASQEGLYIYFQNDNGVARNLRLRIQFGDNVKYKIVCDSKTFNYIANKSKASDPRFVDGGFHWYDDYVKRDDLKFLETVATSNDAKIIFSDGKEIEVNNTTKSDIKRTLEYYEAMDGLLPKSNMVNIRRL